MQYATSRKCTVQEKVDEINQKKVNDIESSTQKQTTWKFTGYTLLLKFTGSPFAALDVDVTVGPLG